MTNTLIAYFVVKGDSSSSERQYLKIVTDYSISTSGATATATCVSTMYVHRDKYGPSLNKKAGDCYITIGGVKQNVIASGTKLPDLDDTYLQIGDPVTHTFTYDGTTDKTVSIEAQFDTTDDNLKINDYIIPVENYPHGTGMVESGSTSLTFPAQITDPHVYIANDGMDPELHLLYIHDATIDPEQPFGKYMPYVFDGTSWQQYS